MKNYIAIGIMLALQSGKQFTAKKFAEKFETSLKTIYRAIDILICAGVPIVSNKGKNGGYQLLKESLINTSFFTTQELCSFISFIKTNSTKCNFNTLSLEDRLISQFNEDKIKKIKSVSEQLVIDTNLWGHCQENEEKANAFKTLIAQKQKVKIKYLNAQNNISEERIIHPYTLVYKSNAWYLYAYCEIKKSFRLFKLSRIISFIKINQNFENLNINILSKPWNLDFEQNLEKIEIELLCSNNIVCDIQDWLGSKINIEKTENENQLKVFGFAYYSYGLIHKIMEFGNKIKILKPEKLIKSFQKECLSMYQIYN